MSIQHGLSMVKKRSGYLRINIPVSLEVFFFFFFICISASFVHAQHTATRSSREWNLCYLCSCIRYLSRFKAIKSLCKLTNHWVWFTDLHTSCQTSFYPLLLVLKVYSILVTVEKWPLTWCMKGWSCTGSVSTTSSSDVLYSGILPLCDDVPGSKVSVLPFIHNWNIQTLYTVVGCYEFNYIILTYNFCL